MKRGGKWHDCWEILSRNEDHDPFVRIEQFLDSDHVRKSRRCSNDRRIVAKESRNCPRGSRTVFVLVPSAMFTRVSSRLGNFQWNSAKLSWSDRPYEGKVSWKRVCWFICQRVSFKEECQLDWIWVWAER